MKIRIDEKINSLRVLLRDVPIEDSDETEDGIIIDYDADGLVVGFELLNATQLVGDLRKLQREMAVKERPKLVKRSPRRNLRFDRGAADPWITTTILS